MIKKLRVTVDGVSYDVVVELFDEGGAPAPAAVPAEQAAPVISAPPPSSVPLASAPASVQAPAPAPSPAAASPAGPGDVPSPLSGRVTAVVVAPGQTVKEGDHLLTLEAMKMNTFVFAPRGGKVAELRVAVAVGDVVEENQVLVKIQ